MKITKRQLRRIIREEQTGVTPKYDDDSALVGGQSKLSDPLQKAIIDKTVEDREEAKEKEAKEKSESIRITKTQLQQIIKEEGYYADLPTKHIDGQPWPGSIEDLAYHQGRAWGHGEVVDQKGLKSQVKKSQKLARGTDSSPLQMTEAQLRRIIKEAVGSVGDVYFITDLGSSVPIDMRSEDNPEHAFSSLTSLPRYAVWGDTGVGKPQVVDSGDDLEELMTKYKLSPDSVKKI